MSQTSAAADESLEEIDLGLPPANLTGSVMSGVKWKAATQVVSEGTRIVVAVVLARLLTPADYGLAGIALVVAGFVTIFTDPALGAALVQRQIGRAHV